MSIALRTLEKNSYSSIVHVFVYNQNKGLNSYAHLFGGAPYIKSKKIFYHPLKNEHLDYI